MEGDRADVADPKISGADRPYHVAPHLFSTQYSFSRGRTTRPVDVLCLLKAVAFQLCPATSLHPTPSHHDREAA